MLISDKHCFSLGLPALYLVWTEGSTDDPTFADSPEGSGKIGISGHEASYSEELHTVRIFRQQSYTIS